MRIVTLATCHNRREKTLSALRDLHNQKLPAQVKMRHIIVDDGCEDGTVAAVNENYPEVEVVPGSGQLFWAGGMRYGWEHAVKGTVFDYLFVYNDDVALQRSAIRDLIETSQLYVTDGGVEAHVVVGSFASERDGSTTYGGLVRSSRFNPLRFERVTPPEGRYALVDTMNMNACLIKKAALDLVGFFPDYFVHGGADFDFGLRLRQHGGAVVVEPRYAGVCERNDESDNFIESSVSLLDCYRRFLNVKKCPIGQSFSYYRNHGGILWPLFWIAPYLALPAYYLKVKLLLKMKFYERT